MVKFAYHSRNEVQGTSAMKLVRALRFQDLSLRFGANIDWRGWIWELGRALQRPESRINSLDLQGTGIGDGGASALGIVIANSQVLKSLD